MAVITCGCTLLVLAPLFFVLVFLVGTGWSALNWDFFTFWSGPGGPP